MIFSPAGISVQFIYQVYYLHNGNDMQINRLCQPDLSDSVSFPSGTTR